MAEAKVFGSHVFTRVKGAGGEQRTVGFDSSPDFTLPKKFGWHAATMRYEKTGEDSRWHVWNVYAAASAEGRPILVGVLKRKTTAYIREEMAR